MRLILLWLIRYYQKHISPLKKPSCRFIPTCSQYALEAIQTYGACKGSLLTLQRLSRCHPFYKGKHEFYDPVP